MIHKTAVVEDGAELGDNVSVGPFSYIQEGTRIGAGTQVGPHATILKYTTIGEQCEIHAGAVLGDVPQDLGFDECESFVQIGSRCRIREGVTIHRGTQPGSFTTIGDDCFLMAFSHFAHNVKLANRVIVCNAVLFAGHVQVDEGAFISGGSMVHQFVSIGRLAMLSGNALVGKDVPPFCTMQHAILNRIAGLNVIGMRRAGLTPEERLQVKQAFSLLFRSGLNVTQAVARIREEIPPGPAHEFCTFAEKSKRGICTMQD